MPVAEKGRSCHLLVVLIDMLNSFARCLAYFCSAVLHSHGFYLAIFLEPITGPALASPHVLLYGLERKV